MKKIYDCFTFFNELDLLELRLEELYDHVDCFVLVESDHTFTNIPKPYYFEENRQRYSKYLDKIQHVKIKSQLNSDPWQNEFYQRECIKQGLDTAADYDVVIISDVDEIPRPRIIDAVRQSNKDISALYTPFFYFKLNFVSIHPHCYIPVIIAAKKHIVNKLGVQWLRESRDSYTVSSGQYLEYDYQVYHHAGWHFGYLGDNEFLKKKIVSFSHASDYSEERVKNYDATSELHESDTRFFVKVDEYFPKTVLHNIKKYQTYIQPDAKISIRDLFPKL